MARQYEPGQLSAVRRSSLRRRTLAVLAGLSVALLAVDLVLSLGVGSWTAFQLKTSLDYPQAGRSPVWPPLGYAGPLVRRHLAAAGRMLAAGDLRGAHHEYLMILLSLAPDSAQAWHGLAALHRRWAAQNPAELGRQVKAYRLAIRNGTDMNERYSPQALKVLAKAAMLAAREIDDINRRLASARPRPHPSGGYVISVGEFASPTTADRMMHLIRSKGYIVEVARRGRMSQVVTRPYRTRQQAEYMMHGVRDLGLSANLVARLPSQ